MANKRVTVTVDRKKVEQIDDLLVQLRQDGLQVEGAPATYQDITQIHGQYDGDFKRLNRDGVTVEEDQWMHEM